MAVKWLRSVQSTPRPMTPSTQKFAWMPAWRPFIDWVQNDAPPLTRSGQLGLLNPTFAVSHRHRPPLVLNHALPCTSSTPVWAPTEASTTNGPVVFPIDTDPFSP